MGDETGASERWSIFLDDGSEIYEDEELLDAEMVQGKLLTIAHTFEEFKEPHLTIDSTPEKLTGESKDKNGITGCGLSKDAISSDEDSGIQYTLILPRCSRIKNILLCICRANPG